MIIEKTAQRELLRKLSVMNLEDITDRLIDALTDKRVGINLQLIR